MLGDEGTPMPNSFRSRGLILAVLVGMVFALAPDSSHAQSHFEGDIGPGSTYEIDVPAVWNHSLVLYAHGLVQADLPVVSPSELPEFDTLRTALLSSGFAVAASSYSSNGWALADAVRRTHQLSGIFNTLVSPPRRTFLMGASLGALVAIKLAEMHARQYDGVLALCGSVGGALPQVQYVGDGRVIFDHYFPDVLPGTPFFVPPGTTFLSPLEGGGPSALFVDVVTALAANPAKTIRWASAANLPFNNMEELADSALAFIGFSLRYTNDLIERVNGKSPYDNTDVTYVVDATPDTVLNAYLSGVLNANVARVEGDPAAVNYYERDYTPSGRIGIPVLTLHNTRDPAVPFAHETMFGTAVANAGRSSLLTQVPVDRWGHCAFSSAEVQGAFASLVQWVETGAKP
jgi:pimeloyl-ACP methyl ester carboxylesterase